MTCVIRQKTRGNVKNSDFLAVLCPPFSHTTLKGHKLGSQIFGRVFGAVAHRLLPGSGFQLDPICLYHLHGRHGGFYIHDTDVGCCRLPTAVLFLNFDWIVYQGTGGGYPRIRTWRIWQSLKHQASSDHRLQRQHC